MDGKENVGLLYRQLSRATSRRASQFSGEGKWMQLKEVYSL
jgi:hypothetical protein